MTKRSINQIVSDAIKGRNAELDAMYNATHKVKVSKPSPELTPIVEPRKPTLAGFINKHENKWAVLSPNNLGGKIEWNVHSVHDDMEGTYPHLVNGNIPAPINRNLHGVNVVGYENHI